MPTCVRDVIPNPFIVEHASFGALPCSYAVCVFGCLLQPQTRRFSSRVPRVHGLPCGPTPCGSVRLSAVRRGRAPPRGTRLASISTARRRTRSPKQSKDVCTPARGSPPSAAVHACRQRNDRRRARHGGADRRHWTDRWDLLELAVWLRVRRHRSTAHTLPRSASTARTLRVCRATGSRWRSDSKASVSTTRSASSRHRPPTIRVESTTPDCQTN